MKKIKALQFLVYVAFGLFVLLPIIQAVGDKNDGNYIHYARKPHTQTMLVTLNGNFIANQPDGRLQVNADYTLQNTRVKATVLVNKQVRVPLWLSGIIFILAVTLLAIVWFIALSINKIIVRIAGGTTFDEACINLIRKTASLLLMHALVDYAYQRMVYLKESLLIHPPLTIVNTSTFSFPVLICAILVFIIAEAFKQGSRLKEEQELTI